MKLWIFIPNMASLSTLLLSVFITVALVPICSRLAFVIHAVDLPDARKVHARPTPRSGGMAMALGAVVPMLIWAPRDQFSMAFLASMGLIVFFGILDDIRNLPYQVKFGAQIAAAAIIVFPGEIRIESLGALLPVGIDLPEWISVILTMLAIVGVTNAINLSDGLDGLAGGIAILCFICIAFIAYEAKDPATFPLSMAIIGAVFGFLRFNTHPANLFMGDSGSQLLGFAAITLSLRVSQTHAGISPLMPLILLGFPILDTLAVMIERIARGKSPFRPDKNHFHHKLMRLGLMHSEAVIVIYILQASLVTSAFLLRFSSEWILLFLYLVFSSLMPAGLHLAEKGGWRWQRYDFIDIVIKGKLRRMRDNALIIRASFRIVESGFPALLLMTWIIPGEAPFYIGLFASAFAALIAVVWIAKEEWLGSVLRLSIYLSIPYGVYLGEVNPSSLLPYAALDTYNIAFSAFVLFVMLTLRFTRRQRGFKTTPMDFLTIFVAVIVPNLPDAQLQQFQLGFLATKIIVFFFGCEVLMGELRGEYRNLGCAVLGILGVVSIRGLLGW